jgi:hypothetical protein
MMEAVSSSEMLVYFCETTIFQKVVIFILANWHDA